MVDSAGNTAATKRREQEKARVAVLNKGIYGHRSMANVKAEMHAQQK